MSNLNLPSFGIEDIDQTFLNRQEKLAEKVASRIDSAKATIAEEMQTFNVPSGSLVSKVKDLKKTPPVRKTKKTEAPEPKIEIAEESYQEAANKFKEEGHPEQSTKTLVDLRNQIDLTDSYDEILRKVYQFYPNRTASEIDDVLEFLLITTQGEGQEKLHLLIKSIKTDFNQENGREIEKRRGVTKLAREAAQRGYGAAKDLNVLFNNMVADQSDAVILFKELSKQYKYQDLKNILHFVHSQDGKELRSTTQNAYINALCANARTVGAILQSYKYFEKGMPMMESQFAKKGLQMPPHMTFVTLNELFMSLCAERYYSASKSKEIAARAIGG